MSTEQKLRIAYTALIRVQIALANHRDNLPIKEGSLEELKYLVVDGAVEKILTGNKINLIID